MTSMFHASNCKFGDQLVSTYGLELKPPDHEIHQVMPTLKHHITRQGTHILEKGLAPDQDLAQQRILVIAPLQNRMEEKANKLRLSRNAARYLLPCPKLCSI